MILLVMEPLNLKRIEQHLRDLNGPLKINKMSLHHLQQMRVVFWQMRTPIMTKLRCKIRTNQMIELYIYWLYLC